MKKVEFLLDEDLEIEEIKQNINKNVSSVYIAAMLNSKKEVTYDYEVGNTVINTVII